MHKGIAALPTVLIIAIIVLVAGLGVASSGFFESLASFGDYESKEALYAAEAGLKDAVKRVVRNKLCNEGGSPDCTSYTLAVGNATVTVSVSGTSPKTITSQGVVKNKKRKLQTTVSYDANDEATQSAWKELTD